MNVPLPLRRALIAGLIALILQSTQAANSVSDARFAKLAKGLNLGHWFSQTGGQDNATHYNGYITQNDIGAIRAQGFTHVRLPIDPAILLDDNAPTTLKSAISNVDTAVKMIVSNSLAVIVDIHPSNTFKARIYSDANYRTNVFQPFWTTLAAHIAGLRWSDGSSINPDYIFLEVMNEPDMTNADGSGNDAGWNAMLPGLVAAVRQGAPVHTILVDPNRFNTLWALIGMAPLSDTNVVYTFHYYDPFIFTHQDVSWTGAPWPSAVSNVPYPSNTTNVSQIVVDTSDPNASYAQTQIAPYGQAQWKRSRVQSDFDRVKTWRDTNGTRIHLGEFGVFKRSAPYVDCRVWHADVMETAYGRGFGWCKWTYVEGTGGFGAADDDASTGARNWDYGILDALNWQIISGAIYRVNAVHSGKAMAAAGAGTTNNTGIVQATYTGTASQLWELTWIETVNGKNWYSFCPTHAPDLSLHVPFASTANGVALELYQYSGWASEKWNLENVSGVGSKILHPQHAPTLCAEVLNASTADGATVQQNSYSGGTNQQWWVNRWAP